MEFLTLQCKRLVTQYYRYIGSTLNVLMLIRSPITTHRGFKFGLNEIWLDQHINMAIVANGFTCTWVFTMLGEMCYGNKLKLGKIYYHSAGVGDNVLMFVLVVNRYLSIC